MATFLFSSMSADWVMGSLSLSMLYAEFLLREGDYEGFRVVRVEHFKEKTPVGHEFHVLYFLKDGSPPVNIIVRIERRPSTLKGASSSAVPTDDSISRLGTNFNSNNIYHHISTTYCTQSPPLTVAVLCRICAYIQDAAPYYNLKANKHCFWFCAAFLIRLRALGYVNPQIEKGKGYNKRGCIRCMRLITEESVEKDLNAHVPHQLPRELLPPLPFPNPLRSTQEHHGGDWTLSRAFSGHTQAIRSVCFSADGGYIISGSDDCTICKCDTATSEKVLPPLRGHKGYVRSVAVSPDGRRIASASDDKTVRIWDMDTGVSVAELSGEHKGRVHSVAFSPNSHKIVSAGDNSVLTWDLETSAAVGKLLRMREHSGTVMSVAWSPDGNLIAYGSSDKTICVLDARIGTPIDEPLRGHTRSVNSVAFSPDGRVLVSGSDDETVRLWDISNHQALDKPLRGHREQVLSIAFSQNGRWIASGSDDKTIRIWDRSSGGNSAAVEVAKLRADSGVQSVAWSPAKDWVAAGCDDREIQTWRKVTG